MALKQTAGFLPVTAALAGNLAIAAAKFTAAFFSGSSVMFSEAVHSAADTLNQILLLIGLARSEKAADDVYEYGYGNERFFWALISACGIFFIGAGVTAYEGLHAIFSPAALDFNIWLVAVLFFSLIAESYTFTIAAREIKRTLPNMGWRQRIRSADPSTLAVFLEDATAVFGIAIASLAIALSYYTGSSLPDGLGSLAISVLLGGIAISLILKNRAYLIGRAMPEEMQFQVMGLLQNDPMIVRVIDFKSSTIGWDVYRIKFEVEFDGSDLLQEAEGQKDLQKEFEESLDDPKAFKQFSEDYADRIPKLMGQKIDEIEKRIKTAFPSIRHIDIEIN